MDEQMNELVAPFLRVQGRERREKFILMDGQGEADKEKNVASTGDSDDHKFWCPRPLSNSKKVPGTQGQRQGGKAVRCREARPTQETTSSSFTISQPQNVNSGRRLRNH